MFYVFFLPQQKKQIRIYIYILEFVFSEEEKNVKHAMYYERRQIYLWGREKI